MEEPLVAPADLSGKFTTWQKLVNPLAPYAIPLLVSCAPPIRPLYRLWDRKFGKSAEGTPPNSYKPVVIFSSRTVKDVEAYKAEFAAYASKAQAEGGGVRACFSFVDRDAENTVVSIQWFDSPADYAAPPPALAKCYTGGYTTVFGGWDDSLKAALAKAGPGTVELNDGMAGYLKDPAADAEGFKTGEMPMIWLSKRKIRDGKMEQAATNFQKGVDRMYYNAPSAVGIAEFPAEEEDCVWSIRVFNAFDGFKNHFPVPSWILFRMVMNVVPTWEAFPIGFSFSMAEDIAGAVAANPGNKAYSQYHYDGPDLIGPKPDFGKGI